MKEYDNHICDDIFKNIPINDIGIQDLTSKMVNNSGVIESDQLREVREDFVQEMRTKIRESGGVENMQFIFL